jgi:alpha,alpha-trehalase
LIWAPVERLGGYLPLRDYGLIGDGQSSALVGRDGAIDWLCAPRFDAPPVFCGLLDVARGGSLRLVPEGGVVGARQHYEEDTALLVTELRTASALVRVTDLFTLRDGVDLREDVEAARGELLRRVQVLDGQARLRVEIDPWGGADAERAGGGLRIRLRRQPQLQLQLHLSTGQPEGLTPTHELAAGERLDLLLRWGPGSLRRHAAEPGRLVEQTASAWRRWLSGFHYEGPQERLVRRSAITLKLLDHFANGAIVAAPTSSLPEGVGGVRNWDYRYAWIRDAAFSVYALRRIGFPEEAWGFLGWVLDAIERGEHPRVLYDVDGELPQAEREDPELEGYRGSRPVRWGNGAVEQRQHDIYGEVLDCAWQWVAGGRTIDEPLWARLCSLADAAARSWRDPDHGIWEVRAPGRVFTYSAALCHVALNRAWRLAERLGLPGPRERWQREAERIRAAVLSEAWDDERGTLTEQLGGGGLDAGLLALPLRRLLPSDDPRMVATTEAIVERLGAGDGLLYRYLPAESPDGLPGHEGAFLLCSFWLVDNLAWQGRLDEAQELFESLCGRAGELGLLPEQIDPSSGEFLGNYPQAFSHIGLIASGYNLARLARRG